MKTLKALTGVSLPKYFSHNASQRENFWVNAAGLLGYPTICRKLELVYPSLKPIFNLEMFECNLGSEKQVTKNVNKKLQTLSKQEIEKIHAAGNIRFVVNQIELDAMLFKIEYSNGTPYIHFHRFYNLMLFNGDIKFLCEQIIADNALRDEIPYWDLQFIIEMNQAHKNGETTEMKVTFQKYLMDFNITPSVRKFLLNLFNSLNKAITLLYELQK